jgi:hypothetical protein
MQFNNSPGASNAAVQNAKTFSNMQDFLAALRSVGLDQYEIGTIESLFAINKIKPQLLFALNDEKLKNMGLQLGIRDAMLYVLGKL